MNKRKLLGRRSRENWGKNSKREVKRIEQREWHEDWTVQQLDDQEDWYPELEEDDGES